MKKYVLGFAMDGDLVLLVRKNKPAWQKGKLNGIGGGIEDFDESPLHAMVREFKEETGIDTIIEDWHNFAIMHGSDWEVYCFESQVPRPKLVSVQGLNNDIGERLENWYISELRNESAVISNVPWLIEMIRARPRTTYQNPLRISDYD